jgi:hypothetical protein
MRSGGNGDDEKDNRAEESSEFLFSTSIYELVSPELLQDASSGYAEDSTRAGNEGNVSIPTPSSQVSNHPNQYPMRPKDGGAVLYCLMHLRQQRRNEMDRRHV